MRSILPLTWLISCIAAHVASAQPAEQPFSSRSCHVSFTLPADWEAVPDTSDHSATCSLTLRPRDWRRRLVANDSVDVFSIALQVFPRGVWRQVSESGFERRKGRWVVLGRLDAMSPADSIAGPGWSGLRGTALLGCYREEGPYAGTCEDPRAVVGTSTRSMLLEAGPRSEAVFDRILATLRFSP